MNTDKGVKYDQGKSPLWSMLLAYFPDACAAVADISAFGLTKYPANSWRQLENGFSRYTDAMIRHAAKDNEHFLCDPESGRLHAAHAAWNAMARLQIAIERLRDLGMRDPSYDISGPITATYSPEYLAEVRKLEGSIDVYVPDDGSIQKSLRTPPDARPLDSSEIRRAFQPTTDIVEPRLRAKLEETWEKTLKKIRAAHEDRGLPPDRAYMYGCFNDEE